MGEGEAKFYKQNTLPSFEQKESKTLPLPEKIGGYKIETLLAKGGMSLLYLGFDPKTRQPRAIKVLLPEYLNHPEMTDHFLWEAKIIGLTNHPNIVKLYDYGKWEQGLYIAMEFIRGVSLRQFLMQQSFSLKRCLDIILQVAYALCHLHTHGVVHRDLKPENILIAEDGEVKVIDFGIAQLHEETESFPRSSSHKIMGTPNYMSPEQKENPANASFQSDIYSLGIITYELVLGKLSYGMISLSLLPAGLQKIVAKAINVSISERYQDIVHFITDLTDYYKSSAIEKDRSNSDQILELMEILQRADLSLSSLEKPTWPQFDIGIAKQHTLDERGLYLDFFKFANNTQLILLARCHTMQLASTTHIANLRGMIKSLIHPYLHRTDPPFDPIGFATSLNTLVCQDKLKETFHLSLLKLIPYNDTLSFLSCGQGPLFHVQQGNNMPRVISSENPLLGEDPTATFADTRDNFDDGDILVLHNLPKEPFEKPVERAIKQNVLLSSGRLAEAVLHSTSSEEEYLQLRYPKIVLALHRIS